MPDLQLVKVKHCAHCGWPEAMHLEVDKMDKNFPVMDLIEDFDCSFNDCPDFEAKDNA